MSHESSYFIDQALRFHKFSSDLSRRPKSGLKWTCLDFRHTFGSMLAMKGESLYKISTLMGNSLEICRRHYAALIPETMTDKGVILVEGWSEEILLPAIARKMKVNLTEKGVSIINVGSTAFLRYAKIFLRKDGKEMNIPVAVITDVDVRE